MKKNISKRKGQTLAEVILALAIFAVFIASAGVLISSKFNSLNKINETAESSAVANAGFEALRGISMQNWSLLTDGEYGVEIQGGVWQLKSAPDTIENKYERTIMIAPVKRDANCQIVETGGEIDPDTKLVTVNVSWQMPPGNRTRSFSQLLTSWKNPTACLAKKGEVRYLTIDVSASVIDATKKSLTGTKIKNTGTAPITLDKMQLTWTKPGNITYIKINGSNYWHSTSGIGSPSGVQPSGTVIDIENFILQPGVSYDIDNIRFDSKVDGSTFTITAIMSDGTSITEITTPPFIP
ncbi:MAG: prepilin-type N-terminal cleavage/methylation domain-containing protein [Parcubacteria group bacterium]